MPRVVSADRARAEIRAEVLVMAGSWCQRVGFEAVRDPMGEL
jgi:hypothetical protein